MVIPFVLQELQGTAPKRGWHLKNRVADPTVASTPATFHCNWNYCENGPKNPTSNPGVVTLMGPAWSHEAGLGEPWGDKNAMALTVATAILRKEGLSFTLPDDYEGKDKADEEEMSDKDREFQYFKENYYNVHEFKKGNETVVTVAVYSGDWLNVGCIDESIAAAVEDKLRVHFALNRIEHRDNVTIVEEIGYTVSCVTGTDADEKGPQHWCTPGTLFSLRKGNKVISKCLCSYRNGEMDNAGPTIELLETAEEWRGHGYGTRLLRAVEKHFSNEVFVSGVLHENVKLSVCYVTNYDASRWFQNRGFRDWDGMGEELGKYLEYDSGDDDDE